MPSFPHRLVLAARSLGRQTWLWWALALLFWVRTAAYSLLQSSKPDVLTRLAGARQLHLAPSHLYDAAQAALAAGQTNFPSGDLTAYIQTPLTAYLLWPVASWPSSTVIFTWTLLDLAMLLAGLLLLCLYLRPRGVALPLYWLLAGFFPPLFAEVDAGQIGGLLLLLAVLAIVLESRRGWLAGALGGFATVLKLYPVALLLGPRHLKFAVSLLATTCLLLLLSFWTLGPQGAFSYVHDVLLPFLSVRTTNCGQLSLSSTIARYLGTESYLSLANGSPVLFHLPWHLALATPLTYLSQLLILTAAVWSAWRSRWNPAYSRALGLALGALLPGEVYPYQMIALLPLLLVVLVRVLPTRVAPRLLFALPCLLLFIPQPCSLPLPNLWMLGGLALFAICLSLATTMRQFNVHPAA